MPFLQFCFHRIPPDVSSHISEMIPWLRIKFHPMFPILTPLIHEYLRNRIREAVGYEICGTILLPVRQAVTRDARFCQCVEKFHGSGDWSG